MDCGTIVEAAKIPSIEYELPSGEHELPSVDYNFPHPSIRRLFVSKTVQAYVGIGDPDLLREARDIGADNQCLQHKPEGMLEVSLRGYGDEDGLE